MTEYFCVVTRLAKAWGKCVTTRPIYVTTELASVGKISVVIELAKARRNYVATDIICVAT